MQSSLVGSVFERASSARHSAPNITSSSGFPVAQHRSKGKSAFARRREEESKPGPVTRIHAVPAVRPESSDPEQWRNEISRQNQQRVDGMTEEERERERQEIYEHFGSDIGDILKRARESREHKQKRDTELSNSSLPEVPITNADSERAASPPLAAVFSGSISAATSRPSTPNRMARKLRFAELSPKDVHVYESAPPPPRKKSLLALPPPPAGGSHDVVSLGKYKGPLLSQSTANPEHEEGSPEDIRRRFFPSAPATNPDLEWMKASISAAPPSDASPIDQVRFDLTGTPIHSSRSLELPTHLGLHHHAEGSHAGYTIEDIFLLARSTVVAQRSAMLGVLVGITKWLRDGCQGVEEDVLQDIPTKITPLLKRILFAGLEVLPERGSVGARGIDVVWHCLIGWEKHEISELKMDLDDLEYQFGEVELNLPGSTTTTLTPSVSTLIDAMPLDKVLAQIVPLITCPPDFGNAKSERHLTSNQHQLLYIVARISKHSSASATAIVQTSQLVASLVNTFLLLPITPAPTTLKCLMTLVVTSRENALAVCDPADALLKFVATSPLDSTLLVGTLQIYTALAKYGLYSHSATDVQELWMLLGTYVASLRSSHKPGDMRIVQSWAGLLEAWIVCATDPHRTVPSHDILWSRVVAWGWGDDVLALNISKSGLPEDVKLAILCQTAVWRSISAWLEGARINSLRTGEVERETAIKVLSGDFVEGSCRQILALCVSGLKEELDSLRNASNIVALLNAATYASCLASVLRLSLACSSSVPVFDLPISEISQLCASLVLSPLWSMASKSTLAGLYSQVLHRYLSSLLSYYLRFSRNMPGNTSDTWLAQAFAITLRLRIGDEDFAVDVVEKVLRSLNSDWANARRLAVPTVIWERGGCEILLPIVRHIIQPSEDTRVGPLVPTPRSIATSTTLRSPTSVLLATDWNPLGLPLRRDWTLSSIDHILRSGHDMSVFKRKGAFPDDWNTSETEIVRVSLLLTKLASVLIHRFASVLAETTSISRQEIVLGCMKVFMLEHEQDHDKAVGEVFRDPVVSQLLNDLIAPLSLQRASSTIHDDDIEEVAKGFLGQSTPFYQYYTDFVALYDAISFADPLFMRLLLPPTSMRYALDYRKHLWVDFGHLIKNIRVPLNMVISSDIKEYLYPVETDHEVIRAYLRALVTNEASHGFTQFISLHHIACSIWPDLQRFNGTDEAATTLFSIILEKGSVELVKNLLNYTQQGNDSSESALVPPLCFRLNAEIKSKRLELIYEWCSKDRAAKLMALFI